MKKPQVARGFNRQRQIDGMDDGMESREEREETRWLHSKLLPSPFFFFRFSFFLDKMNSIPTVGWKKVASSHCASRVQYEFEIQADSLDHAVRSDGQSEGVGNEEIIDSLCFSYVFSFGLFRPQ